MSLDEYKLSSELFGHSLDVRAVTEGRVGTLISGSRDKTAKIWVPEGNTFVESLTLRDHKNFISAVCVLEGGNLICTGSNDATICVYSVGNVVPLAVLKGHTSTVCALAPGLDPNTLLSGSWDQTARLWQIAGFGPSTSITFVGHEAAVWAVTSVKSEQYVTGSADKTICFWNKHGEKLKVLKGHTDCVRGLIGMADGSLISCGNDAVIKYWSVDGECIKEFHGHGNYIYSIAMNSGAGSDLFVTGGEDSTLRMWSLSSGEVGDAILLPAQSVWAVACLTNGDIVTGTSDGVVRVFTKDKTRMASDTIQSSFALAVSTRIIESKSELGGIKVNDLPGPESLLVDGTEGKTKIVRHADGKIMCYQWTQGEWLCLGDVTGASGGSQDKSGKVLYEGKEYDYVFSVDISDTGAPLKLPYNVDEEPWLVAQKFIHKHELPQAYLEQVANFIIKNSANKAPTAQNPTTGFEDPFTGGGRYIPGSSTANHFQNNDVEMVDPFTGASSYRSGQSRQEHQQRIDVQVKAPTTASASASGTGRAPVKHFPHNQYMSFSACDPTKVLDKIKEFNGRLDDANLKVTEEGLASIIKFAKEEPSAYAGIDIDQLKPLLKWPREILFPVLDIVRLAVRDQTVCTKLASSDFLNLLIENMGNGPANQLMAIRCFANMMSHGWGRGIIETRLRDIFTKLNRIMSGSGNLQIAVATLYLNVTITQLEFADQEICRQVTESLLEFLRWGSDLEAFYRAYQALGNLTCTPHGAITSAQIVSVDQVIDRIRDNMSATQPNGFEKINELARDLTTAL